MSLKTSSDDDKRITERLSSKEFDLLCKLSYLARRGDATRCAIKSLHDDYHKRVIARAVYLQVDSFIEMGRCLKNLLFKSSLIDKEIRDELDMMLAHLEADYRGIYEALRDKTSAHRPEEAIESIIS